MVVKYFMMKKRCVWGIQGGKCNGVLNWRILKLLYTKARTGDVQLLPGFDFDSGGQRRNVPLTPKVEGFKIIPHYQFEPDLARDGCGAYFLLVA